MHDPERPYKILILGESSVGKTSLLTRFKDDTFKFSCFNTIGIDFANKTIDLDGTLVKLQIWDTAGQERFRTITQSYYRNAHGILLVFSVADERSFKSIDRWYSDIRKEIENTVPIFLIGNKIDLVENDSEVFKSKAESMGIKYYETSAFSGKNVELVFYDMAREVLKSSDKKVSERPVVRIKKRIKKCC